MKQFFFEKLLRSWIVTGGLLTLGLGMVAPLKGIAADELKLAAYVTNENKDVFVAIYGDVAMALKGCQTKDSALDVLELPRTTKIVEETIQSLEEKYGLGNHPSIPCPGTAVDADLPLDLPLWADLEKTQNYYMEFPTGSGTFYAIAQRCSKLKTAFGIRQRVAMPDVLQEETLPREGTIQKQVNVTCGKKQDIGPVDPTGPGTSLLTFSWRLYKTETYLSEFGDAELLYVAVLSKSVNGNNKKLFLPIYKIDGVKTTEILWDGASENTKNIEKQLKDLFGLPVTAEISDLSFQDIDQLNFFPFTDLCLKTCQAENKTFDHAYFAHPGDLELTKITDFNISKEINILGEEEGAWLYGEKKAVRFGNCSKLTKALGLTPLMLTGRGLKEEMDLAIDNAEKDAKVYVCPIPTESICTRSVVPGEIIGLNHFKPTGDCRSKTHLRLEIQGHAQLKNTIVVNGSVSPTFKSIEIVGTNPSGKGKIESQIKDPTELPSSDCLFDKMPTLFYFKNLDHVSFRNMEIQLGENTTQDKALGIHGENTRLTLDHLTMGVLGAASGGEGPKKLFGRNVRACKSSVFSVNGSYQADFMNVQALATHFLIYGKSTELSKMKSEDYGVVLNSKSYMRIHQTGFSSQKSFQLKDSQVFGTRSSIQSLKGRARAQAFRMSGDSEATFKYSSVREYEKVGLFLENKGKIKFILPTNDLALDNDQLSWGAGQFEILE